jgi:hypothetical protein
VNPVFVAHGAGFSASVVRRFGDIALPRTADAIHDENGLVDERTSPACFGADNEALELFFGPFERRRISALIFLDGFLSKRTYDVDFVPEYDIGISHCIREAELDWI